MPVAVIVDPTERRDLKSLPGGYVLIKRMTFGQKLTRQQMAMKMQMTTGQRKADTKIDVDMMSRLVSLWSFANLIEDHNLEDVDGRKLNLKNVADVEKLTGPIGEEIDTLIDKINNFEAEEEDDLGKSSSESKPESLPVVRLQTPE
jgi:hypothetical protein